MFERRPQSECYESPSAGSQIYGALSMTHEVGKHAARQVKRGFAWFVGMFFYLQAAIWGFGALMSAPGAGSPGQSLFTLAVGCLIVGGLSFAGKRAMAKARGD